MLRPSQGEYDNFLYLSALAVSFISSRFGGLPARQHYGYGQDHGGTGRLPWNPEQAVDIARKDSSGPSKLQNSSAISDCCPVHFVIFPQTWVISYMPASYPSGVLAHAALLLRED